MSDMKVNNKRVITEVAKATYKGNKKRNIVTIIAIMLTTFLITVVITLGSSYWNTLSMRQIRMEGMDYDIELSEPRKDQVKKIQQMESVSYAGVQVKCGIIEQYKETLLDKTRMYWIDETAWIKQTIPALESYEGKYPSKDNEIMLSSSALQAMKIKHPKVGMSIPLTYFTLKATDTNEQKLQKDFVLSGYYKDYSGNARAYVSKAFFEQTGVKQTDFTQGTLKISLHNKLYTEEDIIKMQKQIRMDHNQFISADYDSISSFIKTALGLIGMLFMIFLSGYLFVYNTLYISITKDIHYYGQLKTLGMTSKQLKSIVYKQAIWNSCIGIPIGLVFGILASIVVIPRIIHIVDANIALNDVVHVQPWIYVLAAFFAFLTNLISSRKPACMVGACSPVEAMKYLKIKKNIKKHRNLDINVRTMALQNMFRDKKQAFIILLSFVIAVSIFLVVNVVIVGNNAKTLLNALSSQDITFKNETMLDDDGAKPMITDKNIEDIKKIDGVKSVSKVRSTQAVVPYQEEVYGTFLKTLYNSRYTPGNYEEDIALYKEGEIPSLSNVRFIGIDAMEFDLLNKELGGTLDKIAFEKGSYAVVDNFPGNEQSVGMMGKTTNFYVHGSNEQHSIKIGAVIGLGLNPAYFSGGYLPSFIVSDSYAQTLTNQMETELINVIYEEPFNKRVENNVRAIFKDNKKVSSESKIDRYDDMKQNEIQIKIIGNSIGIIMALLALLNYINMMVASVQNRSVEFATLESIGMTSSQQRLVLRLEGFGYALLSTIIAFIIGVPLSYLVFESMNQYQIDNYTFPWFNNLVLVVLVFTLCMIIPVYTYRRTQQGSIVDRLRDIAK